MVIHRIYTNNSFKIIKKFLIDFINFDDSLFINNSILNLLIKKHS